VRVRVGLGEHPRHLAGPPLETEFGFRAATRGPGAVDRALAR
jgi:hypothetical protein